MDNNNKYLMKYSIDIGKGDKQIGTVYLYGIAERVFAELYTRRRVQVLEALTVVLSAIAVAFTFFMGSHMDISNSTRLNAVWSLIYIDTIIFYFLDGMLNFQQAIDDREVTSALDVASVVTYLVFFIMTRLTGFNWGTLLLGLVSLGMQLYYSVTNVYLTTNYLDNVEQNLLKERAKENADGTDR